MSRLFEYLFITIILAASFYYYFFFFPFNFYACPLILLYKRINYFVSFETINISKRIGRRNVWINNIRCRKPAAAG